MSKSFKEFLSEKNQGYKAFYPLGKQGELLPIEVTEAEKDNFGNMIPLVYKKISLKQYGNSKLPDKTKEKYVGAIKNSLLGSIQFNKRIEPNRVLQSNLDLSNVVQYLLSVGASMPRSGIKPDYF